MSTSSESERDVETKQVAAEKKLVRKVDWMLMPILMLTLGLQYYDKAVLGSAAVFGILEDMVSRLTAARIVHRSAQRQDLIKVKNGVTDTTRYSTVSAAVSPKSRLAMFVADHSTTTDISCPYCRGHWSSRATLSPRHAPSASSSGVWSAS